jgi:hypothetical protein
MGNAQFSSRWYGTLLLFVAWLFTGCGAGAELAPAEAPSSAEPTEPQGNYGYSAERDLSVTASDEMLLSGPLSASEQKSKSSGRHRSSAPPPSPPPAKLRAALRASAQPADPSAAQTMTVAPTSEQRAPLLIYSAGVTMAVFGLDAALHAVEELARARHGYLVRRDDTSITIRVPAAVFEETLSGVSKLGDELHREVNVEDITEQYADLEIRLRNAEVVRQRLESLLAKASSVEDALAVERELARVTGVIEQLKGKRKLLGELVAFSTISVTFQARGVEHINAQPPLPFDWLQSLGLSNLLSL